MSDGYGRSAANPLTREQTIDLIVKTCLDQGVTDQRQIAYVLATTEHESGNFAKPEEDFGRQQAVARGYQGGENYFGRGYAHLTHRDSYQKLGQAIGRGDDLMNDPALAADPEIAAKVMVVGMRDGLFTTQRLDDFIGPKAADYEGARKIVNGIDKKTEIATLATNWEARVPDLVTRVQRDGVDLTRTTPTPGAAAPLREGDANARVFELQQYLKELNVTTDAGKALKPDGDFGAASTQAVRNYQRSAAIDPPTGTVDQALFDRIKGEALQANPDFRLKSYTELHGPLRDRVLNPGDRGDPVFELRQQLAGLGHLANAGSNQNSRYDTATQNAVRSFQRDENIEPANGLADERTRDAINARAVAAGLPETADVATRRQQAASQPQPSTQPPGTVVPAPAQGARTEGTGQPDPARPLNGTPQTGTATTGQPTHVQMFERVLGQVHDAERERGIPPGGHSRNLAGVLTVATLREGINSDRVELNRDGTSARAVEVSPISDHPAFNRSTDPLDTAAAIRIPQQQSADEAERVAAQREVAQREAARNQQIESSQQGIAAKAL